MGVFKMFEPEENNVEEKNEKQNSQKNDVLKVSSKSDPNSVAGAIAGTIREHGEAELQAVGAGAVNQVVKAIAISRGYVAPSGLDLICVPGFKDIEINGEKRTAIKFVVEAK